MEDISSGFAYKKGDPSNCANYRPISLLCVGYKVLASVILRRLKNAGAESRIWSRQFGFKSNAGTTDALFLLRRVLDDVWAEKDASVVIVALDWAKAFDCISPDGLIDALRRFGLPLPYLSFIGNVYGSRQFYVRDMGEASKYCAQFNGFSQGCPLSPFLFVMLMTVIMHDSTTQVQQELGHTLAAPLSINDLLYADDTLLINYSSEHIQKHMDAIISVGAKYGLEINWQKVDMMGVRCHPIVSNMNGVNINEKTSIQYLGASLSVDGYIQSEVSWRIGMATADFNVLDVLWTHANVSKFDKYKIYISCIISKLLYGLQTVWLTKQQRNKLDGFHARCVRKIVGIKPSYLSRVPNTEVLAQVNSRKLSVLLLQQQLGLFGKIFRKASDDIIRQVVFEAGTDQLVIDSRRRRRGRPKLSWAVELQKIAIQISGGRMYLQQMMANPLVWRSSVKQWCGDWNW